jgi:hypothetical protein
MENLHIPITAASLEERYVAQQNINAPYIRLKTRDHYE